MSLYGVGETFHYGFDTYNSSNALANADSLPTGTLVVNGSDTGATVTISTPSTGLYQIAVSLAGRAVGDEFFVRVSATVGGVTQRLRTPPCRVAFAAAITGGVPLIGSSPLTNLDAAVSSRSTFAGGAVASVTGNVGGSVASVTGAVGSVTGAVGSVTAPVTVGTNNDKTGYSIGGTKQTLDALNDLSAAGIRTAVGLAAPNTDTQFAAILAASGGVSGGLLGVVVSGSVSAVVVANLPATAKYVPGRLWNLATGEHRQITSESVDANTGNRTFSFTGAVGAEDEPFGVPPVAGNLAMTVP